MPCKPKPAWRWPSKPDPLPRGQGCSTPAAASTSEAAASTPTIECTAAAAQSSDTMSAQEFQAALKAGRVWYNSDGEETWKREGTAGDTDGASGGEAAAQDTTARENKVDDDVGAAASRAARGMSAASRLARRVGR